MTGDIVVHFGVVSRHKTGLYVSVNGTDATEDRQISVEPCLITDGNWVEWGEHDNTASLHIVFEPADRKHLSTEIDQARKWIEQNVPPSYRLVDYAVVTDAGSWDTPLAVAVLEQSHAILIPSEF